MAKVTKKAANYSEADVAVLRAEYTGSDNTAEVAALSTKLGKTAPSVRAKLASLGIYKAAEKAESDGERITKMHIAEAIAEKAGLGEHEVEGLAKATKSALEKVLAKLA